MEIDTTDKKDILIKRNNEAPGFSSSLSGNRGQLIIERYIQQQNIPLEEYIKNERILNILIPVPVLRQWYPGPNWKKDLAKVCSEQIRDVKEIHYADGNFRMMRLIAFAELSNEGLLVSVLPQVLHYYLVGEKSPYSTSIEYNLTTKFLSRYSHEIYWEICKHDNPREHYSFFITPQEINTRFDTNYNVTNIINQILKPTQEEIKSLYDQKLSPRYFTFNEKKENRKIIGWELQIHNIERENRELQKTQECYKFIENVLNKYIPKYKLAILSQIRSFPNEKIIQLFMRLEKFEQDDKQNIKSIHAYLCTILQHYNINPYSTNKSKNIESSLFEKEERDLAEGLKCWLKTMRHIEESKTATPDVKKLFSQVKFYSFSEIEKGYLLTLQLPDEVLRTIKIYFNESFNEVISLYFPINTTIKYYTND